LIISPSGHRKIVPGDAQENNQTTRISQAFQCFFIDSSLVNAFDEIKDVCKRTILLPFADDTFYRCLANTFQSTKTKTDLTLTIYSKPF